MVGKANLQELEHFAVELAWSVGRLLLDYFQKPIEVEYKSKERQRDPVTEADRQAEALIKEQVSQRFPSHGVVGEEGAGEGAEATDLTWVVDPLDGTTNFVNGLPLFASSIAMLDKGRPVIAAVFLPWPSQERGVVLHARSGGGSWEGERELHVRDGDQIIPNGLVGVPRWFDRMFKRGRSLRSYHGEVRVSGSIVYEMAMVSTGVLQYSVHGSPHIWDVAAGTLLVQEAGGIVLTRSQDRKDWYPFETFASTTSISGGSAPGQQGLRSWQAPMIATTLNRAHLLGEGLTPRRHQFRRLMRRLRAKFH